MDKRQTTLRVGGMTCASCERRVARALEEVDGVLGTRVSLGDGSARVDYDGERTKEAALKAAVEKAGYPVITDRSAGNLVALGIGIILVAGYLMAQAAGLFNALPRVDAALGYGMLFVVGLLTSVHCVAMCGGIALSQGLSRVDAPPSREAGLRDRLEDLKPGLLYNGGRVLAYTVTGGLVGALGSIFDFSPLAKGAIAAVAGAFMLLLGLRMFGILPRLPRLGSFLPAGIRDRAERIGTGLGSKGPFAVGLLNGLMPCGPLQTMQLYALGTGSILAGALSMFIFSLGTVPLMLVFGLTSALLPRKAVPVMVKASSVLVMFLGILTFGRAASLAGIALPEVARTSRPSAFAAAASPALSSRKVPALPASGAVQQRPLAAKVENGAQTVITEFGPNNYVPFVVQAGVPLKWTIRVKAGDLNGCNNPVTVPAFGIRKTLVPGDNLIEFTPGSEGTIGYSCWMGMIRSRITVVRDLAGTPVAALGEPESPFAGADQGFPAGLSGSSCCSGAPSPAP